MEARSRLSQTGTPSIIVFFDRSDLTNASGDVASIFLSALNTPDYRLAMSVRTTHLVRWTQKEGSEVQDIVSNERLAQMKQDPEINNLQILRDEGMYLTFFAADEETQQAIQGQETKDDPQPSMFPPAPKEQKSSLEGYMRPKS